MAVGIFAGIPVEDYSVALEWVVNDVAARERDLQSRNDEIISTQAESLRVSADRRRIWLQERIREGRSTPIIRMRQSQLARLETDVEGKLAQLDGKRAVSLGYRLMATGVVARRA